MAFQFFRKYQKPILYTAGFFALMTFSITGALMGFFDPSAASFHEGATMTLPNGRKVVVTYEDAIVAKWMVRAAGDSAVVLPNLADEFDNQDLVDRYAAIRRLAIEFGIEASDEEVDRAIARGVETYKNIPAVEIASPTQLALKSDYSSLAGYRQVIKEALRIGTFLRLQALGANTTDAALADHVLKDEEKVTLRLAYLNKKDRQDELEKEDVSDEDLQKWLGELEDVKRRPYQATNKVSLVAVGLRYDDFDATEFQSELEGVEINDAKLNQEYEFRKDQLFKRPKPEPDKPENGDGKGEDGAGGAEAGAKPPENTPPVDPPTGAKKQDDGPPPAPPGAAMQPGGNTGPQGPQSVGPSLPGPQQPGTKGGGNAPGAAAAQQPEYEPLATVKVRLTKMLQAEAVLDKVRNGQVQDLFYAHMRELTLARNDTTRALQVARKALTEAEEKAAKDADDKDLEAAVAAAKTEVEAKEAAVKAAGEALAVRRKEFDFAAEVSKLLGTRQGLVTHPIVEPTDTEGLKELGELGKWTSPYTAQSMSAGDISTRIERTKDGCFYFQVPEVIERPLKPFDEIKEQGRSDYFTKKADSFAEEASKKMKEKLLELAKAKVADEIAEIEKKHADQVTKGLGEWKTGLQAEIAEADESLQELNPRTKPYRDWVAYKEGVQKKLAAEDTKREELAKASKEKVDEEIEAAARKAYKDVLEQAIVDTGFGIETLPPYSKNISQRPRFDDRYDDKIKFLFRDFKVSETIKKMEPGDATDLLDDAAGRALYVAVCESVEKATLQDLTRRQFLAARDQFVNKRMTDTLTQSFSMAALEARWGYLSVKPRHEPREPQSAGVSEPDGDSKKKVK